jgi:hypothetical protein
MGRPRQVFDRHEVVWLRDVEHLSWSEIGRRIIAGVGTVVQAYRDAKDEPRPGTLGAFEK